MNKNKLVTFIRKYHLGGMVDKVMWITDGNSLKTNFKGEDNALIGEVILKEFKFEPAEIGIYDTKILAKLLSVLNSDVDISLQSAEGKSMALKMSDTKTSVNFSLASPDAIELAPKLKTQPEYQLELVIDDEFVDTFSKAKSALDEVESFAILSNGKECKIIIGYDSHNSNTKKISISVKNKSDKLDQFTKPMLFSTKYFKELLSANRDADSSIFYVSNVGLASIKFETETYVSEYFLTELE